MGAEKTVQRYQPQMPAELWRVVEPFVTSAIREASGKTRYTDRELFAAATPLTLWAWQSAGLELQHDQVFARATIDRFIHAGLANYSTAASRNTLRSRLNRLSEALGVRNSHARPLRPLGNSDPIAPYPADDQTALRTWAQSQQTAVRVRDARNLLALGMGAGLLAQEVIDARAEDVCRDRFGVRITVRGVRPREVTLLAQWEKLLDTERSEVLFRAGRGASNKNLVSNFVANSPNSADVTTRRMRSTWIVHHLTIGTPVMMLMAAAGVKSLEAIDRFARFAPTPAPEATRIPLRGTLSRE